MPDKVVDIIEPIDAFNTTYTVAAGTQISTGIILKLTDPRTAIKQDAPSASSPRPNAGIAAFEKEAGSDTSTKITVHRKGIFKGFASGAIVVGDPVVTVVNGYLARMTTQLSGGLIASGAAIAGYSLETAADGDQFEFVLDL